MAANEAWVLDGVTLTSGNFDILELNVDPPKARLDWISAADSEGAALMRTPEHENRTITMKLRIMPQASMNAAMDQIGVVLDKFQKAAATPDGVALAWTPANSTRTRTFDVLNGEIVELPVGLNDHAWSWFKQRPIFTMAMTAKPYWRDVEASVTATSSTNPVVTVDVPSVAGDVAAIGRLVVTEPASQSRRYVEWGLEQQFYTPATPTSLVLDSDSLTVTGFGGTQTTRAGAYDPNATGNNVIRATLYQSTNPTAVCGTGNQPHVGTFRVKARVWASSTDVRLRLAWQDGDGPTGRGDYVTPVVANAFSEVDLGVIAISAKTSGTQRWTGSIEAYGAINDTLDIDYLLLLPASEGYGKVRASPTLGATVFNSRDEFTGMTVGTALNGRVAPLGGTWATSGSATDFTSTTPLPDVLMQRAAASDAATAGRFAILGATNYTDTQAEITIYREAGFTNANEVSLGAVARYVDASNHIVLRAAITPGGAGASALGELKLDVVVAGVITTVRTAPFVFYHGRYFRLRLVAYASGRIFGFVVDQSGAQLANVSSSHTAAATGGALATGKPGFMDRNTGIQSIARAYDAFFAAVPPAEPIALYSGRTLEVRHNDTLRQDSTGTYYGRPPSYRGARFTVPQAGADTKTSRVVVKAHRNDLESSEHSPLADNLTIQVFWTSRGLAVPR